MPVMYTCLVSCVFPLGSVCVCAHVCSLLCDRGCQTQLLVVRGKILHTVLGFKALMLPTGGPFCACAHVHKGPQGPHESSALTDLILTEKCRKK